jgi:hypothetical protein
MSAASGDAGDLNDVSSFLLSHDRQHSLCHRHCTEEVGFELFAEFFERAVFGEATHREPGIVHEHINATKFRHHAGDEGRVGVELRYIESENVDLVGKSYTCGSFVQFGSLGRRAHGRDYPKATARKFDGGEQSDSAGGSGDDGDFLIGSAHYGYPLNLRISPHNSCVLPSAYAWGRRVQLGLQKRPAVKRYKVCASISSIRIQICFKEVIFLKHGDW